MKGWLRWLIVAGCLLPITAMGDAPPQVTVATPGSAGSNGGAIQRFTIRFSEAIVPLGDPRATPPGKLTCPVNATGRWVDQQTFVYDFEKALPGGLSCKVELNDTLKSARGVRVEGTKSFTIDTGGPSARGVLSGGDDEIEEEQIFLVATNVAPTAQSVAANAYCAVDGIGEKIAVDVLKPEVASTILDGLGKNNWQLKNFLENAGLPQVLPTSGADRANALATIVPVKCRRPLPPGHDMALVWDAGIASADGRTAGRLQRFDFTVRKAFEARWECSRVNPQAGCNPVTDAHVRFAAKNPDGPGQGDPAHVRRWQRSYADGSRRRTQQSRDFRPELQGTVPRGADRDAELARWHQGYERTTAGKCRTLSAAGQVRSRAAAG